jgi:hypothetical protein
MDWTGERWLMAVFYSPFTIHHSRFFGRRKLPRIILEHHRDAVPDGIAEAAGLADELVLRLLVEERALAERADEYVEELAVHFLNRDQ